VNDLHKITAVCIAENNAKMINEELKFKSLDVALVPNDFKFQSLEEHLPNPSRKKGGFYTSLVESFTQYCTAELQASSNKHSACFINNEKLTAKAIFDVGTINDPEHCENFANFVLEKTQEFIAITEANNTQLAQLDFTYWLEDYRPYVANLFDSVGEPIEFKKAIHALRKITFTAQAESNHNEAHLSSEQSGFTRIEAKSGSEQNLPATIEFKCKPSPDLDEISIHARIIPQNAQKSVQIKLQLIKFEKMKQDLALSFKEMIQDHLKDLDMPTYIGTYQKQ
tara:strand:+ start:2989 stop:3834 length:846 start_codon:yes stop_codon:yes gene_type:complete